MNSGEQQRQHNNLSQPCNVSSRANVYALAARAMSLHESIPCGPRPDSCDIGHHCAAHGGDYSEGEDWTPKRAAALAEYERRWGTEVMR